jgi:hypothetical protein
METAVPSAKPSRCRTVLKWAALGALVWGIAVAMVALETVTLTRDASALRGEMLAALDRPTAAEIQLSVGPALLSAARLGLGFVHDIPDEALRSLNAARAASVGVYTLSHDVTPAARAKMLVAAERAMSRRGWTRVVGVNNANETVVIYMPTKASGGDVQRICLAVCEGGKLIVVDASADVKSLVELAGGFAPRFAAK